MSIGIPSFRVADVVDREVVVLAPKEGDRIEGLLRPQDIECRDLTLTFRDHPVFDPDAIAGMRIGPARDVARGEDAGRAGFEELIDPNSRDRCASPACSASSMAGRTPTPTTTKSASMLEPSLRVTRLPSTPATDVPK